jgi:hypothetical protein
MSYDTAPIIEPVTVIHGHTSPETAYVVENYPYGGLRCRKRYWVETATKGAKKGEQRLVTQTTNPKKAGEVWNKPHPGGYSMFVLLYMDGAGHVHAWQISMYSLYGAAEYRNHLSGVYEQLTDEQRKYYDVVVAFSARRNPTTYYEADWTLAHVMNHIRDTGDDPQVTNGSWITPRSQRVYLGFDDDPAVITAYARSLLGN